MDKVLIVEDNAVIGRLWEMTLREAGFDVALAETGRDGIEKARSAEPQLVLLDLVLPDLDGFAVFREICADPELSRIPVIFLTNFGEPADVKRALYMGAADFIVKSSILPEQLIDKIRYCIDSVREKRGGVL